MQWFEYPVCVPFGNPNYDAALGGSHDMDVRTPPNTMITALADGVITDISAPAWGKQVCLKVSGYNAPYMAYLHLSAVHPSRHVGEAITTNTVIGWSGGCTSESQYTGTQNPTGENFLNTSEMSSQPQTGIALMYGPVYGSGAGWVNFPPIDFRLDPMPLIRQAIDRLQASQFQANALVAMWNACISNIRMGTGIYNSWFQQAKSGAFYGPAVTQEITGGTTWDGTPCIRQYFLGGWCEWVNGISHWYKYL